MVPQATPDFPAVVSLLGLGPEEAQLRDVVAVLLGWWGCTVPMLLRTVGHRYEILRESCEYRLLHSNNKVQV